MESEQGVVKYKLKYGREGMFISIIANELLCSYNSILNS